MNDLVFLMIAVFVIGYFAGFEKDKALKQGNAKSYVLYIFFMVVLAAAFVLFSGLRTRYNDTVNYIESFKYYVRSDDLSFSIIKLLQDQYYGFAFYQRVIKHFFNDAQWLIMISAVITNIIYLKFFSRHSETLGLTMLCYITIGTYLFSMAAMKQILAMSISLVAIEFLLKKNYIVYYLLIILAYTFHPYILVLCILPIIMGDVWSKKIVIITLCTFAICMVMEPFLEAFLGAAENVGIGKGYSVVEMLDHTINPLRVIADGIPILLAWFLRSEINEKGTTAIKLGINMMTIAWLMTFASLFANPIYFYRTGLYFANFIPLVVPWMLVYCLPNMRYRNAVTIGYMAIYVLLFIYDLSGFNFSYDPFMHTTINALFT